MYYENTISVLVHQLGLTPAQVSALRLTDLHLAGKSPSVTVHSPEHSRPKTVELNLEAHRALVGWLVARPDSVADHLFVDEEIETGLSPEEVGDIAGPPLDPPAPASNAPTVKPVSPPTAPPKPIEDDTDATMVGTLRPTAPLKPPRSAPEMGAPPPGFGPPRRGVPGPPPMTAPESDGPPTRPPFSRQKSESSLNPTEPVKPPFPPRPSGPRKPRVPPKPVPRKSVVPTPIDMDQKPEPLFSARPPAPEAATTPVSPVPELSPAAEPNPFPAAFERSKTDNPASDSGSANPDGLTTAEEKEKPAPPSSGPEAEPATNPEQTGLKPESATPALSESPESSQALPEPAPVSPRPPQRERKIPMLATAIGGGVGVLLLCFACVGISGWTILQGSSGDGLLAGVLGAPTVQLPSEGDDQTEGTPASSPTLASTVSAVNESAFESPVSPLNSPLQTPTLPSTSTPTSLPPTNTPSPTDTPVPEDTPTPTDTPVPTATDTPTPVPPTDTPVPDEAPAPEEASDPTEEPAPGLKYDAPVLAGPKDGIAYTGINEIALTWQPVGELADNEHYAVRLIYRFNNQVTYGGANVKENQWVVPLKLYGQIDPPDHIYEWFVQVEQLQEDGSGTAISPESARRQFSWK